MTTMNFETTGWRRESLEGEVVVEPLDETRRRRTRRALIIGAVLAVVALVAAYLLYGQSSEPAAGRLLFQVASKLPVPFPPPAPWLPESTCRSALPVKAAW
jgi:hypothetical protein